LLQLYEANIKIGSINKEVVIFMFKLKDKVAVITGGMGQLGVIYAVALVEQGARVAVLDLENSPKLEDPAFSRFCEAGSIKSYVVDITNRKEIQSVADNIRNDLGVVDILINNAALDSPPDSPASEVGPFETYPEPSYDKVMDVNVKGTLLCCQVFGKDMAEKGCGSIINISSTYGILSPCQDIYDFRRVNGEEFFKPVAYSISKSAILNLTRYLATYWAKSGVRVNTLTLAGVFNNQPQEFLDEYCKRMPVGRMAEAEEFIGPVLLLASDASSYMTGSNLVVDGGWSAW
jgi:NAD(P)-dependent dehydrogenase (short-subunit alcohol dehydrogenase family)